MRVSALCLLLFRFFLPPALIAPIYLYLYPAVHGCNFPQAKHGEAACLIPGSEKPVISGEVAPFRLLTLADPQLEGDTSLPDPNAPAFPSIVRLSDTLHRQGVRAASSESWSTVKSLTTHDIPKILQGYRKQLDLFGNDYYLAHIYRSLAWWANPTHTVVLGDLLGSQWIDDGEFQARSHRFWERVFSGAHPVPSDITGTSGRVEVLGEDEQWAKRIISVAGNHDIGYAGDLDDYRIVRFERAFGHVNWGIRFRLNETSADKAPVSHTSSSLFRETTPPELHLVILNSMNLDEPAYNRDLREQTLDFISQTLNHSQVRNDNSATVLLTHIPLHKEAGICVDAPYFTYFTPDNGAGIREQNHLRPATSEMLLDGLGPRAIILNGHDHEGCDTFHFRNVSAGVDSATEQDTESTMISEEPSKGDAWAAKRFRAARRQLLDSKVQGYREITVRSMMGSYGGNAGLLSGWYDTDANQWRFEYASCILGLQHIWWAVHVLVVVEVAFGLVGLIAAFLERFNVASPKKPKID